MASPLARDHALIWGSVERRRDGKDAQAWQLCQQYIDRRVSGVFFAPIEGADEARRQSPDRGARSMPRAFRSCSSIATCCPTRAAARTTWSASTIAAPATSSPTICCAGRRAWDSSRVPTRRRPSMRGRPAIAKRSRRAGPRLRTGVLAVRLDPADRAAVSAFLDAARPDAIVCANDRTAGPLMQTLQQLGRAVPRDIRLAGIDDVEYAALLPVPLTTLRQPTRHLGRRRDRRRCSNVSRGMIWRHGKSCCPASWSCGPRRARSEDPRGQQPIPGAVPASGRGERRAWRESRRPTRHAATMMSRLPA